MGPWPECLSRERPRGKEYSMGMIKAAIFFGTSLSICISWSLYKSVSMAILHGILSWLYVIYYAIKESKLLD
jgi:hypothetical protein